MATERQREQKLNKNIADSKKKLSGIIDTRKRAVDGTISKATEKTNFVSNATVRSKLYADLAKQYQILDEEVSTWTVDSAEVTMKDFFGFAEEDVPDGSLPTFNAFSKKYANDIIGEVNPSAVDKSVAMNARIGGMLQEDIRVLRAAVSTTIAEGAVEGLTNAEMAKRMQEKIAGKVGNFQFIDKAGRKWTADNYFGMLNQTLHSTVARDTYIDVATAEAGFDLYQIEGGVTGSSVDYPGDPCDKWAGRIISMTGKTSGYPTYQEAVDAGVWHPRCVHFLRVVLPSEIPEAKAEEKREKKQSQLLSEVEEKKQKAKS